MTYFQSKAVPSELSNYQAEFNYYSAFRNIKFTGSLENSIKTDDGSIFKKISLFFSKWYGLSVILLLASMLFIWVSPNGQIEELQANSTPGNEATILPIHEDSIPPKWIVSKIEDLELLALAEERKKEELKRQAEEKKLAEERKQAEMRRQESAKRITEEKSD